jgi:hypothetical protein
MLELLDKLQGLGIGGICLFFLWITNRWWSRKDEKKDASHEAEKVEIRKEHRDRVKELNDIIDTKNTVITDLANKRTEEGEARREDMERFLTRDAEREARYESHVTQHATVLTQYADAFKELRQTVQSRG